MYAGFIILVALFRPAYVPALPAAARTIREDDGTSGLKSLGVLILVAVAASVAFDQWYTARNPGAATDELIIYGMLVSIGLAFLLAVGNKLFKLGLLSRMAERVTFVLIPPLALIFLVLGTIFLGIATPTEGGAMGASGALIMALARKRLTLSLMKQAMDTTAKLSCFVLFILIGSTVFNLVFQGVDGSKWVEHLLLGLPGGQIGFLIVTNALVFVLAFFLDFFELSFIIVPLLGPVAAKLGIDLIWFGVLLGVNMQTSFMHPPFGFALFYLRSVAAHEDYVDKVTKRVIAKVTTEQIYWGAVPFVIIQVIMVALVIAFPGLVTMAFDKEQKVDIEKVRIELQADEPGPAIDPSKGFETPKGEPPKGSEGDGASEIERQLSGEAAKK
jgi:GntP family gluconate:H+ symporter